MSPEQQATLDTFYAGATQQDATMIRPLLTDDFTFKSPLMGFDNPDDYVAHLIGFCGRVTHSTYMGEGHKVAHTFDLVAEFPGGEATIRMCDVFTFDGPRIAAQELFADSNAFPKPE